MKLTRNMTKKELNELNERIYECKDYISRINRYDDDMIFNDHGAVCETFGTSPDQIDQMINDIFYGLNSLSLELDKEIKRRSERA